MNELFTLDKGKPARPIWAVTPAMLADWCAEHAGSRSAWVESNQFTGAAGQVLMLPDSAGGVEGVLLGLGKVIDPFAVATLPAKLPQSNYRLADTAPAIVREMSQIAWAMGTYQFRAYKGAIKARPWPSLVVDKDFEIDRLISLAQSIFIARDLINTPAADMGPEALDAAVRDIALKFNATHYSIIGDALLEENYPMIHAVGRAAEQAPRFIELTWGAPEHPEVCLVGKGVCFDTGGLNLKPGNYMDIMKKDMGGAAIALGLAYAIMDVGLPVRLRLLIGAVENAIGPNAFRPGDILNSRNGMTVEIGNTDAEGRLVLADLLTEAASHGPDVIIDFATLTGAARVAVGPEVMPFFTRHDDLARALEASASQAHDPIWRFPLWEGYDTLLDSNVADVNHISNSPMAGSIIAGLFLARFVPPSQLWAHFDVYGWNIKSRAGRPVGGEATALRAVFRYLESHYGKSSNSSQQAGSAG